MILLGLYIIGVGATFALIHQNPTQPVFEAIVCICWPIALVGAFLTPKAPYGE